MSSKILSVDQLLAMEPGATIYIIEGREIQNYKVCGPYPSVSRRKKNIFLQNNNNANFIKINTVMKPISAKQQFYCQYVGQSVRYPGVGLSPILWTMVLSTIGQTKDDCILVDTAIGMNAPIQLRLPSQMTDDEAIFVAKIAYAVLNVTKTDDATLARLGRNVLNRPHLSARTARALIHFGIVCPLPVVEPGNVLRIIEPGEAIAAGWCEVKM